MFDSLGLNKEKYIHTLPLQSLLLLSLHVPRPLPRPSQLRFGWSLRWITYRKFPRKIPSLGKFSFTVPPRLLNIIFPALPIVASLSFQRNYDLEIKPRENSSLAKKSAKVFHSLYSSTEQLQVALWTYMSVSLGLNNEKSLHTLPLRSVPFLSLPLTPSLFNPSLSSPWSVWLIKLKE